MLSTTIPKTIKINIKMMKIFILEFPHCVLDTATRLEMPLKTVLEKKYVLKCSENWEQ
jgi:hypothetical protein